MIERVAPSYLSKFATKRLEEVAGVHLYPQSKVEEITLNDSKKLSIQLSDNRFIEADYAGLFSSFILFYFIVFYSFFYYSFYYCIYY